MQRKPQRSFERMVVELTIQVDVPADITEAEMDQRAEEIRNTVENDDTGQINPRQHKEFLMIIIHRCSCGHPDVFHQHPRTPESGYCSNGVCVLRTHELGMPELIPTFVDGQRNEYVHKPGSTVAGMKLCDCADCEALYAEMKNDAVPLRSWCIREAA